MGIKTVIIGLFAVAFFAPRHGISPLDEKVTDNLSLSTDSISAKIDNIGGHLVDVRYEVDVEDQTGDIETVKHEQCLDRNDSYRDRFNSGTVVAVRVTSIDIWE
jgi:hypothetical protein